jgi:hypothetical protein
MSYREAPTSLPLIFTVRERVVAIDPESGALRWEQPLPGGAGRLFLVGETLVVTARSTNIAHCFDLDSGVPRGHFDLGFRAETGLVRGDQLFLAGADAIACITASGALAWGAWVEGRDLVFRNRAGEELWRMNGAKLTGVVVSPGLLLGDLSSQPDYAGHPW